MWFFRKGTFPCAGDGGGGGVCPFPPGVDDFGGSVLDLVAPSNGGLLPGGVLGGGVMGVVTPFFCEGTGAVGGGGGGLGVS